MQSKITVALAGNPNSGKTTIFNNLTGTRQHVGNYPGVTVERKQGRCRHKGVDIQLVDLPGTYSLTAYSAEEVVARNFIIDAKPDVVVDVIDASNLERNLYLAVQIMELGVPLVLVFNMSDQARARGYQFDLVKLSGFFGARIVETVGHKGRGMDKLLEAVIATAGQAGGLKTPGTSGGKLAARDSIRSPQALGPTIDYGPEIEPELEKLAALIGQNGFAASGLAPRWLALKLLENDQEIMAKVKSPQLKAQVERSQSQVAKRCGENPETAIAARRYGFISGACKEAVRSTIEIRHTVSDRIDALMTNRILGLPVFLGLMYLVFYLTFTIGQQPMDWIDAFFSYLAQSVSSWWPAGSQSLLKSLMVDGIIGGVGGVIIFLPNILLLFLAIAVLEDTGYMARAAFIMDRLMHKIGLHGKSFIPMLIGFGCSVPAIMATRTLENRRDRLTTMLVVPLMSCGARLPIYALIIPAFFPRPWHAPMLWIIYMIGILLAVASAKLLRVTILKGESVPFVMELPPYRMPTVKSVLLHMWERGWLYLRKAGTVILGISIVLWAMTTFPGLSQQQQQKFNDQRRAIEASYEATPQKHAKLLAAVDNSQAEAALENSIAGRLGRLMEPLLRPMGFDWKIGTALIGAFAAKEVFVAQMGIVYAVGAADEQSQSLREKLQDNYSPLVGFCIMLFCLISTPCMATIAITRKESNSWKWALFQLAGLTALAWVLTATVYLGGSLLGLGTG